MDAAAIREAIQKVARKIVTVRSGTVVSNLAPLGQTLVHLDNDDSGTPVAAQGTSVALPAGTRVSILASPTLGLLVLGPLVPVAPFASGAAMFTYYASGSFTAAQAAPYRSLLLRCQAGGGAGGGAPATTAGNSSGGGGGGGGGYVEHAVSVASLIFPLAVTVGAGGTGVSGASGNTGGNSYILNGDSSVLLRALGGTGGSTLANAATIGNPADGGSPGSWDIGSTGGDGGAGHRSYRITATVMGWGMGGFSGSGGGGGPEVGATVAGVIGYYYGGGGSGAHQSGGGGALAGGDGRIGIVSIIGLP